MNRALKSVFRPLYSKLIHLPTVRRAIVRAAAAVSTEINVIADFVEGEFGEEYGVTKRDRRRLVSSFHRNCRNIDSAARPEIHTVLAMDLLSLPRHISGDVIECGAAKGATAASLSLLCRITERRLLICDSFEGLKVQRNIRKFGDIGVCEFVPGLSSESLQALSGSFAFAFLDVKLIDSMKDCLRFIWPLMADGGVIYSNDAAHMDIVHLFFDDSWWQEVLHEPAPGLVGSGCGLPLGPKGSTLSYVRKSPQPDSRWGNEASWLQSLLEVCDN
ncbi:MAG: class I SAM-dependent methyltransferase [Pirellulales bacterium]